MNACCIWHGTYKTLMMSHMLESDMITVMGHVITVIEHRAFFHMRWIPMLNWCEWLSESGNEGNMNEMMVKMLHLHLQRNSPERWIRRRKRRKYQYANTKRLVFVTMLIICFQYVGHSQQNRSQPFSFFRIWFQYWSMPDMWQILRAVCVPTKRQLIWWAGVEYPQYYL